MQTSDKQLQYALNKNIFIKIIKYKPEKYRLVMIAFLENNKKETSIFLLEKWRGSKKRGNGEFDEFIKRYIDRFYSEIQSLNKKLLTTYTDE